MVSNGDGSKLAHRLSINRNSNTIRKVVKKAIKINGKNPKVIATDGFSSYTKVIRNLSFDVIHVRHIHKPPFNRITIEFKEMNENGELDLVKLHCTNEIFVKNGAHYGTLKITPLEKYKSNQKRREKKIKLRKLNLSS